MKQPIFCTIAAAIVSTAAALALTPATSTKSAISGEYLEVRSCDVYTGPCFANAEMGLTGREGILVWSVSQGAFNGVDLKGLSVIAVVKTDDTLGDQRYNPRSGDAVLVVDAKATAKQRAALTSFARSMAGGLIREVVAVKDAGMTVRLGACDKNGCSKVKADDLVEISTRCLGGKDHLCGNEENYYPPLTELHGAFPAYTELAAYRGTDLNLTWESTDQRSAYLGTFSR